MLFLSVELAFFGSKLASTILFFLFFLTSKTEHNEGHKLNTKIGWLIIFCFSIYDKSFTKFAWCILEIKKRQKLLISLNFEKYVLLKIIIVNGSNEWGSQCGWCLLSALLTSKLQLWEINKAVRSVKEMSYGIINEMQLMNVLKG